MNIPLKDIGDFLVFVSGIVFFVIAIVFASLFWKYKKRDYLLLFLGSLAGASLMVVDNLDVLFSEDWESDLPELLSGIFSFILVTIIVIVLRFPDKVPIDFEEQLWKESEEKD